MFGQNDDHGRNATGSGYGTGPCSEALLAAGADLEKAGPGGITPLMRAAYRGHVENLRLLLAHGADVNRVDRFVHDARYYAEQYRVHLRSETEEEGSAAEADEARQAWFQAQKQRAQLCLVLLGGPGLTPIVTPKSNDNPTH